MQDSDVLFDPRDTVTVSGRTGHRSNSRNFLIFQSEKSRFQGIKGANFHPRTVEGYVQFFVMYTIEQL